MRRKRREQEPSSNLPDDWWEIKHVALYLGIYDSTWTSYVCREQVPGPERYFGRTGVWKPAIIKALVAERGWHTLD